MAKDRSGYTFEENGKWYARITFTDSLGKRRNIKRRADNKTHGKELLRQIVRELEEYGERTVESSRMTFNELSDYFEPRYLIPPQYVEGRKVAGLRSHYEGKLHLKVLRDYFGKSRLRSITQGDLQYFKTHRLSLPTRKGSQRAIASVNRELSLLSRMLSIAKAEGWILRNPFESCRSIICLADEKKRERIITLEEENRLLEACTEVRSHLRPIIICALDTGMRLGEIIKLQWKDVDFDRKLITIQGFNTKTLTTRLVAMTTRLEKTLLEIYPIILTNLEELVFGIRNNVKHSFTSVRKTAKLTDVRFHDLRHTAATRLVSQHLPLSEVGRILGHTQANTTYRYVNANSETAYRAAKALDTFLTEVLKDTDELSVIN